MKKSITIVLVSTLLVTTLSVGGYLLLTRRVDFESLHVDLTSAAGIGIGYADVPNESPARGSTLHVKASSSQVEDFAPVLVMQDKDGNISPVQYLNDNDVEVNIPLVLQDAEVIGDFTYAVYIDKNTYHQTGNVIHWQYFNNVLDYYGERDIQFGPSSPIGTNLARMAYDEKNYMIAIHNPTGKIFDFKQTLQKNHINPAYAVTFFNDGFAYYDDSIFGRTYDLPPEQQLSSCAHTYVFDETTSTLSERSFCSKVRFEAYHIFSNGSLLYKSNNYEDMSEVHLHNPSSGTDSIIHLSFPMETSPYAVDRGLYHFVEYENLLYYIKDDQVEVFDINMNRLNLITFPYKVGRLTKRMNDRLLFISDDSITTFNLRTENIASLALDNPISDIAYSGDMLFALNYNRQLSSGDVFSKINLTNLEIDFSFELPRAASEQLTNWQNENVFSFPPEAFKNAILTGFVFFDEANGLSSIRKQLNIYTGEVSLINESNPILRYSSIQPLN